MSGHDLRALAKFRAESDEWLQTVSNTRAALEIAIGLLRDELEDLGAPVGTVTADVITMADRKALKDRAGEYARDGTRMISAVWPRPSTPPRHAATSSSRRNI